MCAQCECDSVTVRVCIGVCGVFTAEESVNWHDRIGKKKTKKKNISLAGLLRLHSRHESQCQIQARLLSRAANSDFFSNHKHTDH